MARRHLAHAGMRLIALGDNAQLLVQAPAPPPFPAINDLNLGARHGFKADLTVDFKAYSFAMSGLVKARAGLTRRLRQSGGDKTNTPIRLTDPKMHLDSPRQKRILGR